MRPSVLIVDDNPSILDALRDVLALSFPHVHILQADSGAHAIARFLRHRPEIVVMDVQLPDADGIDLTQRIMAVAPLTTVVVISIQSEPRLASQALTAGAAAFIAKDRLFAELTLFLGSLPCIRGEAP